MKIFVDADACPKPVKNILYRVAERTQLPIIFVANTQLPIPRKTKIKMIHVPKGFDVADNYILNHISAGDLIITADIPLAAEIIDAGGHALNPRGELYTSENIRSKLNIRDFMESIRGSGIHAGGPPPLSKRDRMTFANALDRFITKHYL